MRAWIATVAGTAAALALAGTANAGTQPPIVDLGQSRGLTYSKVTISDIVAQGGEPLLCEGADEATGGGGSINGNPRTANLNATRPTLPEAGWLAEGRPLNAAGRNVTTFAICGNRAVEHDAGTDSHGEGAEFNSSLTCFPAELTAITGGIAGSGGNVRLNGTFPNTDPFDWTNSFQVGAGGASVTSTLSCTDAYDLTTRKASSQVSDGEAGKAIRRCKDDEAVAGGGFQVSVNGIWQHNAWAVATKPWDSKDDRRETPDDGWLAKVYNDTGETIKLTSFATCKQ